MWALGRHQCSPDRSDNTGPTGVWFPDVLKKVPRSLNHAYNHCYLPCGLGHCVPLSLYACQQGNRRAGDSFPQRGHLTLHAGHGQAFGGRLSIQPELCRQRLSCQVVCFCLGQSSCSPELSYVRLTVRWPAPFLEQCQGAPARLLFHEEQWPWDTRISHTRITNPRRKWAAPDTVPCPR